MSVSDKVVIVTGGAKGLGRSYCLALANKGARVVIADIDFEAGLATAAGIEKSGGKALALRVDVTSEASTTTMASATVERYGTIDVLINNAALVNVFPRRKWEDIPVAEWDSVMTVNVKGPFLCSRAVLPYMKEKGGRIINISSARVWQGTPGKLHYTTSKAAIIGFTRALAREVGEYNIAVNAITPGQTLTESQIKSAEAQFFEAHVQERCLKRLQAPEDLVGVVLFLVSDDSSMITGQALNVDGGATMH